MAEEARRLAGGATRIDAETHPARYRHWKLSVAGEVATLAMDVDENCGLFEGYLLKLNSYDLGVDIELADALLRLRFEHPQVKVVVFRSAKERVFCAGANIRMLAGSSHAHKVNFCKFTNETRNAIEDASAYSGQKFLCVVNGTAAGGGYEIALAADHILLVDDGSATVSLPEVPLLAVLPGTGGLTRLVDKRKVRRDLADYVCTFEEGVKGRRALKWRLVDELSPASRLEATIAARAAKLAATSERRGEGEGIALTPLRRSFTKAGMSYRNVTCEIDHGRRIATITMRAPDGPPPADVTGMMALGAGFWPLEAARELDDAILHLRFNAPGIALVIFRTEGDAAEVLAHDAFLEAHAKHWAVNEVRHLWKRVLKRIDLTSKSLVAVIEPGSCFAGTLAELALAADRSYMLIGARAGDQRPPATLTLGAMNGGAYPMCTGLTRLATRFLADESELAAARAALGQPLEAEEAEALGLVTFALDDIDWDDELRVFLEARTSFSPDSLTGMEANLRFAGPETMESKIFARLTAWQNWIFQRPNAVGEEGALRRYGTGVKASFDMDRV